MSSVSLPNSARRNLSQPESRPDLHVVDSPRTKTRSWRVIHACEYARDVLPVIEGQVAVGMRPFIVTPRGSGTAELYLAKKELEQPDGLSLLRAWQDVRNWRKSLLECDAENSADLIHTHSFASGMAGVRNLPCVVYDLNACIEELAMAAGQCERGSWMARSFRVAEQFIVSRAKAIIVHSLGMKTAVEERGAPPANVFIIPAPVAVDELPLFANRLVQERFGIGSSTVVYLFSRSSRAQKTDPSGSTAAVLEAFRLMAAEVPDSRLFIETEPAGQGAILGGAERLGIRPQVVCVEEKESAAVTRNADVVIAAGETPDDPVQARYPNHVCLQALSLGKALLAADVARNRDATPDGRGCLWFREGDVRDLAYRMAFLANNPDFRATLAASGRAFLVETRSSAAVGHQYDAVYRHALKQKRASGPNQGALNLLPIAAT
jgi:glycosyltransferase involved in cell wall biosynthesis